MLLDLTFEALSQSVQSSPSTMQALARYPAANLPGHLGKQRTARTPSSKRRHKLEFAGCLTQSGKLCAAC
jgi:hypothetical protein